MNRVILSFVAFLSVAIASDVVVLTPSNFKDVVNGDKNVLVEFYAPWCGHCKNLAPEYEIVATSFKKEASVVVAKVDCDEHKDLAQQYGVKGFPTLKFFKKGSTTATDFDGRDSDTITENINKLAGTNVRVAKIPSAVAALTASDFEHEVIASKRHALVEFYAPWCGHCKALAPIYEELGKVFAGEENVLIAKVNADAEKSLGTQYGISGFPTLKYFAPGSTTPDAYEGGRTLDDFVKFINEKAGTFRTSSGGLTSEAGRIKELDAIVSVEITTAVLAEAEKLVASFKGTQAEFGDIYVKVIKKILDKGTKYVGDETSRLTGLLSNDNVSPQKKKLFALRKNILEAFVTSEKEEL